MEVDSDFTLTLLSNGSEKYFPNNTLTSFENQLPQEIVFSKTKDWCMSMQDIGIHLNYENFAINKDSPIILTFDASHLLPIVGTKINQLESAELITPSTLVISTKSSTRKDFKGLKVHSNFHQIPVEALRVSPQLFSVESIVSKISEFILKSDSLRDNLEFKTFTHVVKGIQQFTKEENRHSIKGLKEFAIKNPSVNVARVRQVGFKNISYSKGNELHSNFPIAICIHSILYEALQLVSSTLSTKIKINNQTYFVKILNPSDIFASPYVLEKNSQI